MLGPRSALSALACATLFAGSAMGQGASPSPTTGGGGGGGSAPTCQELQALFDDAPLPPGVSENPFTISNGECRQADCDRLRDSPTLYQAGCDTVCCQAADAPSGGETACENICADLAVQSAGAVAGTANAPGGAAEAASAAAANAPPVNVPNNLPETCSGVETLLNANTPPGAPNNLYSASNGQCAQSDCDSIEPAPTGGGSGDCNDACCITFSNPQQSDQTICQDACASDVIEAAQAASTGVLKPVVHLHK